MKEYREKGMYDVPADSIDLSVNLGEPQPSYNPGRYMEKQRSCASETRNKLGKESYSQSRYK
jgi:hypothetical protein